MDDGLVQNCNQIVGLLLPEKAHVNDIIKRTGLPKAKVFKANNFLAKAHIANRIQDKKKHKQKIFVELTDLGLKIAGLLKSLDDFETISRITSNPKRRISNQKATSALKSVKKCYWIMAGE